MQREFTAFLGVLLVVLHILVDLCESIIKHTGMAVL